MGENYILDFNDDYDDYPNFTHLNCRKIVGSRFICSDEAKAQLKQMIAQHGIRGLHFLDSGDYHYITKLMCDQIDEPFDLVLFDHHTDMQEASFGKLLTCGDWVCDCIEQNPKLHQVMVAGPDVQSFSQLNFHSGKLKMITEEDFLQHKARRKIAAFQSEYPVYLSVDKDILAKDQALTNWSQGQLDLKTLQTCLQQVLHTQHLIGADICGMPEANQLLAEQIQAKQINQKADKMLIDTLQPYLSAS
ncbi:MAG TPA: arginase family protein [Enterococcus columbae]|nr:arginase family protein [Enterococcus columbae]